MTGSAQRCDCHHSQVLAVAVPGVGLAIKDRRHSIDHATILTIDNLVNALDPNGTSYRRVLPTVNPKAP